MYTPYIIAALATLLALVLIYTLFVPKNESIYADDFETRSKNPLLRAANIIGKDIFKSLPAGFMSDRGKTKEHPRIEALLTKSGNPWNVTASEFITLQYVGAFLGFLGSWIVWIGLGVLITLPWWVVVPAMTIFCAMIPRIKYNDQAKTRDLEFKRQLPDALDLLIISLSGGRTFQHAIHEIIPNMSEGILKEEFKNIVKQLDTGYTLNEALDAFAERAPSEGVETFVRAVQSATTVNAPIIETLEARAEESRNEFFALIREKAAQLESRMFLFLTPTLMPACLLVALAPSMSSLMSSFGS